MVKVPARHKGVKLLIISTALTVCQPAFALAWQEIRSEDKIIPEVIITVKRGVTAGTACRMNPENNFLCFSSRNIGRVG